MSEPRYHILIVGESAEWTDRIASTLAAVEGAAFELHRVAEIRQAALVSDDGVPDAALVSIPADLPDPIDRVAASREALPLLPLVILVERDDPDQTAQFLRLGAQDVLRIDALDPPALARALRFAMERHLAARSQGVIAMLDRLGNGSVARVASSLYGAASLSEMLPEQFQGFLEQYQALLEKAVDESVHKQSDRVSTDLLILSEMLGSLRAGPGDVIDLHIAAVRGRLKELPPGRARAYLEESRLVVLKLMGNLVSHYRRFSMARPQARPTDSARE